MVGGEVPIATARESARSPEMRALLRSGFAARYGSNFWISLSSQSVARRNRSSRGLAFDLRKGSVPACAG
jgi:hypothetical protein